MIPRMHIEQWASAAPWSSLAMIEQDMIISRALIELYQHPKIAKSLAFRGGTALNKLFITPPARYSEDLDFVQIHSEPIGEVVDAIRSVLDMWLGEPKRKLTERSMKLIYRYSAIDGTSAKLKIEINTTEHFQVEPLQSYYFTMKSPWFENSAHIVSYQLNELMGTKLRALYQRRKGRDLFDLWLVLQKNLINPDKVVSIFEQYCDYNSDVITRGLFEQSLYFKKQHIDFQSDINPLLAPHVQWNFSKALTQVEEHLIQKIKGDPWKGLPNSEKVR